MYSYMHGECKNKNMQTSIEDGQQIEMHHWIWKYIKYRQAMMEGTTTPSMPPYFPRNFVTISLTGVLSKALTQVRTHKKPRRNVTLCKIYTKLSIPWSTWSTCLAHFPFFGWDPFYLQINKVKKQLDCLVGLQVLELRKAKHCLAHAAACEAKSSKDLAAPPAGSCQTREVSWKPTPLHENIIVDVSKRR